MSQIKNKFIEDGSVTNAKVSGSAAIAYSKLSLSNSIVNADIASAAAIAYSKLSLSGSIVNADLSVSAAIARSKIATGVAAHVVINDGSGNLSSEAALDITRGGTGQTSASSALTALLPSQSGNNTRFLHSNGTSASWADINKNQLGLITYFDSFNFSRDITGVSTYNDSGAYIDGTGGTATALAISQNTTTPLSESADLKIAKSASSATGMGVTLLSDTISNADRGRRLWLSFEWDGTAANYINNDFKLYAYDVTNSVIIPVIAVAGCTPNSSTSTPELPNLKTKVMAFITPQSTCTQVRISLHCLTDNASAAAYNLFVARPVLGPNAAVPGAIMTDWITSGTNTITGTTTNPTKGTTTQDRVRWRRVGDSAEIQLEYKQTTGGSAGSGDYLFAIPAGMTIDSNKIIFNTVIGGGVGGDGTTSGAAAAGIVATDAGVGIVSVYDTTRVRIIIRNGGTTATAAIGSSFFGLGNANLGISASFRIPISGWPSSASLSTTDVALMTASARASGNPASATAGNPIIFPTKDFDTTNSYSTSTGLYTAARAGKYLVTGAFTSATSGARIDIYVNSSSQIYAGTTDSSNNCTFSGIVSVVAGDTISIRPTASTVDAVVGNLSIEQIPDFNVFSIVADSTDVELYVDTGNGFGSTNNKVRRFTNVRKNTLNSYATYADSATLGASVTINIPGMYEVRYTDLYSAGSHVIGITVNGSALTTSVATITWAQGKRSYNSGGSNLPAFCNATLRLQAGDIIRPQSDGQHNGTDQNNIFSVIRIGA